MRTGLDKFFVDNFIIAILLSICCFTPGLVLSILGVVTCQDAKAKSNATVCLIISVVLHAGAILGRVGGFYHW
jgi:hypothetical protein